MDYDTRVSCIDQLKARARVSRVLEHLSSDDFLSLDEEDRKAHVAAYRLELPSLQTRVPNNPFALSQVHLLGTYLQLYE